MPLSFPLQKSRLHLPSSMCVYHYCYFSACQHGQLTRISYCDNIAAPDPPVLHHSPDKADANSTSKAQHAVSSPRPSMSKANENSLLRMNTQQQHKSHHNNTMSTTTPSEAGHPPALHAIVQAQNNKTDGQAASTSRPSLIEEEHIKRENMLRHARSLLDSQGLSDININIALKTKSSLQPETVHDVSLNSPPSASGYSVDSNFSCTSVSSWEHVEHKPVTHTTEQSNHSPRKPIPSQWLARPTSPKLATAQRAKERVHKKGSENVSPGCAKTVRATRSSTELDRPHSRAGGAYLTKETLAAAETTVTPPASAKSPAKVSNPSKPAWNSPTSPQRGIVRQRSGKLLKTSPNKPTHLATNSAKAGHSRGLSNVTASSNRSSFRTAEGSPVRSPVSTEYNFWSTVEDPEDLDMLVLDLNANVDYEQNPRDVHTVSASCLKANSAKLALRISIPNMDTDHDQDSEMMLSKVPGVSEGKDAMAIFSLKDTSSMPRVGAMTKDLPSSRIPAVQRTESLEAIRSKADVLHGIRMEFNQRPLSNTNNDSNEDVKSKTAMTPNSDANSGPKGDEKVSDVAPQTQQVKHTHFDVRFASENLARTETGQYHEEDHDFQSRSTESCEMQASLSRTARCSESLHRTPSSSSEREPRDVMDPILMDSAIIYSRKMTDEHETGNTSGAITPDRTLPTTLEQEVVHENAETIQEKDEDLVSNNQKQGKELRRRRRIDSDLRATATEFIPKLPPASGSNKPANEPVTLASLQDLPGLPDMTVLDKHGIPFLWYMYGIQFAYEQGFQQGRPKSPRKFKPRKPRTPVSLPGDPLHPRSQDNSAIVSLPTTVRSTTIRRRDSHAEFLSLRAGNVQSLHQSDSQEGIQSNFHETTPIHDIEETLSSQPFANQFDEVAEHIIMSHERSDNTPRHYNIDFTKIQNAGFPMNPRNIQPPVYDRVPRREYRNNRRSGNGLYGGRGNPAGIPIGATAPFPNPVPPQGRPEPNQPPFGVAADYSRFSIGREACGMVDIISATELVGGGPCNGCDPNH